MTGLLAQAAAPVASGPRLVIAALLGIGVIVLLITRFSVHPFLAVVGLIFVLLLGLVV